jgi:hypothetical protein
VKRCSEHQWEPLYQPAEGFDLTPILHRHSEYKRCRNCGRAGYYCGKGWRRRIVLCRPDVSAERLAEADAWNRSQEEKRG